MPAFAALVCLPAVAETWRSHPYALTHYNLLAGGPAGGADLGMNRQFWGYATRGILPWIERARPPQRARLLARHQPGRSSTWTCARAACAPTSATPALEEPGVKASDIAMVIHEKHFRKYEYWIWDFYGTARPSLVLDDEGVPIVTVYERPEK